jgi:hypothetical protein
MHLGIFSYNGVECIVLVSPRRLADALPFLDRMATLMPTIR